MRNITQDNTHTHTKLFLQNINLSVVRILLPIRETRRDVGRGLSKTNLESKHS